MALDTRQKLVSCINKSLPWPDERVTSDADLLHILWQYAGDIVPVVAPPRLHPLRRVVYRDEIDFIRPDGTIVRVMQRRHPARHRVYMRLVPR